MTYTLGNFSSSTTVSWGFQAYDPEAPRLVGGAMPEFSTCTDLVAVADGLVWDVNRYYRDLGIEWPYKPTRAEVRRAFREGEATERRTFCVTKLLDREVRPVYDRAPFGTTYMDEIEWAKAKARMLAEMRKRQMDVDDEALVKRVFEAVGIKVERDTPDSQEILDNDSKPDQDEGEPAGLPPFPYAYYVWKTAPHDGADRDLLALWQPLIVRALSDLGVRMRISLGVMGFNQPHDWSVGQVGARKVAYVNRRVEPSSAVAATVAQAMIDQFLRTT